ncbi:hypothetical protein, partial [Arhodomonas sp. AD133]|uniref:hypothetical protein n=1 Tax=Arhodomonas sp. AD133 TaxID=3415009 RepID=UPI003EB70739
PTSLTQTRSSPITGQPGRRYAPDAYVGKAFGEPLTVQVRDVDNTPVAGVTVTFTVTSGSAELSEQPMHTSAAPDFGLISTAVAQSAGASTVSVTTDADGRAGVYAAAGENSGAVAVTAEATGVDEPVRFALSVGVTAVPVTGLPGLVVMALLLFVMGGWMTHARRQ